MRTRSFTLCALAVALSLGGCEAGDGRPGDVALETAELEALDLPRAELMSGTALSLAQIEVSPPPGQGDPRGHRLIRTGQVELEVDSLAAAVDLLRGMVESVGGYVASSGIRAGQGGARRANLTLRVPSDRFAELFDGVDEIGRVVSSSQSIEDVSRAYFDAETRQRVREETIRRLEALIASGGDLEDLLAAERELGRAVEELESLKGQLRYYDLRIAESDLHVTLTEPGPVVRRGVFRPVVLALRGAAESFAESLGALIRFAVFLTPWLVAGLLSWLLLRRAWRARRQQP